ncbi:hypothetical protein WGC32_04475 [Zongyangia sp. HA2173]|uniref:hypothetical protein n=1 Tax=Zongyangia sp. HA2173 TaxID=3133035 RepID=UPI0031671072
MTIIKYPSEEAVNQAIQKDEPLLVLISYNEERVIMSSVDDAPEHHILLKLAGFSELDIDQYFRIVLDKSGADWTFVCPPDYKGITNKQYRLSQFYKDGFTAISHALSELGYLVGINIPTRYQRYFDMLGICRIEEEGSK